MKSFPLGLKVCNIAKDNNLHAMNLDDDHKIVQTTPIQTKVFYFKRIKLSAKIWQSDLLAMWIYYILFSNKKVFPIFLHGLQVEVLKWEISIEHLRYDLVTSPLCNLVLEYHYLIL